MAYKPQLMLAIPLCLLAARHYRTLAATAASALATVVLAVLFFGIGAARLLPPEHIDPLTSGFR
jgi:hypothetical protein